MTIIYNELKNHFKTLNITDEDKNISLAESLEALIKNNETHNVILYRNSVELFFFDIQNLHISRDGLYCYDYRIKRDCDIIKDFLFYINENDIKISFIIANKEYRSSYIKEFLLYASIYDDIYIRISFLKLPIKNKEIKICYTKYLCNNEIKLLLIKNKIITDNFIYMNGVCINKNINYSV